MLAAALALVAACNGDTPPDTVAPDPDVDVEPPDDEPDDELEPPEDEAPDAAASDEEEADEAPDDDIERLEGDPSTDTSESEGEPGMLAVTDVRVGTHGDFDRVVFELEGEGTAGWHVRYDDEPTSQGSGMPIEVAGDAFLAVAIHNVALPPELPEGVEPWDGTLAGPDGGIVVEVVADTIFEGIHTFVVGTTGEYPFLVERLEDPQRVVIDVVHDE